MAIVRFLPPLANLLAEKSYFCPRGEITLTELFQELYDRYPILKNELVNSGNHTYIIMLRGKSVTWDDFPNCIVGTTEEVLIMFPIGGG